MRTAEHLQEELRRIDGRGYKAYKDIRGSYRFDAFTLFIDHVQGDPFAAPSLVRVRVPQSIARFPRDTYAGMSREVALRDLITRRFWQATREVARGGKGSGRSGLISVDRPGQEVLERSSAVVNDDHVEVRLVMGLPAFGRKVAGRQAIAMFMDELPVIVERSMLFASHNVKALYRHAEAVEDADHIRGLLEGMGLVAFLANDSVLPRASGIDPRPKSSGVVPFTSPPSLEVEVEAPNRGRLRGMGVPEGVTLIVGGGYHGKSTLLDAIQAGVYDHIPGDGREMVVSRANAMKIRAEDGRRIERVDISPFISNLPLGQDTVAFSTENASGSTSQAANIMEALEVGTDLLLIDEDTSATNFMIRDRRMQELVAKEDEPITPFVDKVGQLRREHGVSTILVLGGSGDYFDVADTVIRLSSYVPEEVTEEAKRIAEEHGTMRAKEGGNAFGAFKRRVPLSGSLDPSKGRREVKVSGRGRDSVQFGTTDIDLSAVEQIVHESQSRALANAMVMAREHMDGRNTMAEVVGLVMERLESEGLDALGDRLVGDHAAFRAQELAAAIDRLRTLEVYQT